MNKKTDKKDVVSKAIEFKKKFPITIAWRLKSNSKIVEKYLNPNEEVLYVFTAQKNDRWYDFFQTAVVVLTSKRIIVGRKRLIFGHFVDSITPDVFCDLKALSGMIFGKIIIDTIKETVVLSNIDKKALDEIETNITEYMMEEKKKYTVYSK